ncbi:hypothetical protein [Kineococcus aurantiacus]|uniref:Uncharacterized protein n=1 Tax=Kineococcus aurantiacus TaxID=37633 RepID=A0A7Y9DJH4_9ACTN|nr:hypothetical protein [Kineococcus aurantiacus]NYD20848.1 hypothetical protein [Kineococcus aurantiacus]
MDTPWLTSVLTRGLDPDPSAPWRAGPRGQLERDVRSGTVVRVVGDVVVAADVEVDAHVRARALGLLLPAGVVVLAEAALWVHAGPPLPAPAEVRVACRRLPRPGADGPVRVVFGRARPPAADVVVVGPLRVTTPARSLRDVAAGAPAPGAVRSSAAATP